ncbi:N-acetylmuramoyl-L-alanine amidase [Streptomyces sp. NPDC047706]|uniref:N-acetylmuramoyl-L-alanine amidase n=1 Tax=Streptomyces sp. NPDC047706 TaxID=3365486 RepID=UPI003721B367
MALKLVSRSQWGARAYRTPNGATPYSRARRGVKLHYLGTTYYDRHHAQCAAYVRQIQAQHMDGNGWSDIGYSFVVCTHGYVYEGRGLKRRNSANGNTTLNDQDYAVLLMVGSSGLTAPTDAQLHGARDAIEYCRSEGPAGTWLGGHRDGYATACPGDTVYAWVQTGAPRPNTEPAPPTEDSMPLTKADVETILKTDGIIKNNNPSTRASNPHIAMKTAFENEEILLRRIDRNVAALQAANEKLVGAVATLTAGLGDLDPAAIVSELRAALESITVRLDVPDEAS